MTVIDIYHGDDHLRLERDTAPFSADSAYLKFIYVGPARYFLNGEPIDQDEYLRFLRAWS